MLAAGHCPRQDCAWPTSCKQVFIHSMTHSLDIMASFGQSEFYFKTKVKSYSSSLLNYILKLNCQHISLRSTCFFSKIYLFYSIPFSLTMTQNWMLFVSSLLWSHQFNFLYKAPNEMLITSEPFLPTSLEMHVHTHIPWTFPKFCSNGNFRVFFWTIKTMCKSILKILLNTHLFMNIQDVGKCLLYQLCFFCTSLTCFCLAVSLSTAKGVLL